MIRPSRIGLAHAALALFGIAILVKAAQVQLVEGRTWRRRADRQQAAERVVPAPRGNILDATHKVLAESQAMVRLEIAPREVHDRAGLRLSLERLHVDPSVIARALDTSVAYLTVPGRFLAVDAAPAVAIHGVHSFATLSRSYSASHAALGIIGHVDADNKPVDGLELTLDSLLRGTPGETTLLTDPKGKSRESPVVPGVAPTIGNSVVLTINADLQEIAERALADAVARMGAEGGDIVILDPHTGEVLAMASRRPDPNALVATALTEPFEPGSTAKPFIAAGLLDRGRVSDADSVDTGNGVLEVKGRSNPIRDEHLVGRAPLAEVLRWSSNIGIVKFSARLSEREEYETLRDFGFGTPTGLPFPTESPGVLRPPRTWSSQSGISMAMGYEMSVTPVQLAAAYAVFANGGDLVEPALVKEVVGPDGSVQYRHQPRIVRHVLSPRTADKVRRMLLDVVDEGTALQAALDNYLLAGKTGTPRANVRGHYVAGRYNPNFVGLFPGDAPQYVIVVKLTAPQSSIFAAETAAPTSKVILQAAIAARDAALDRARLVSSVHPARSTRTKRDAQQTSAGPAATRTASVAAADSLDSTSAVPFVATFPLPAKVPPPRALRRVPDVRGLDLRDAVQSLHQAGFRVQLARGGGPATTPGAGQLAQTGTLVRLLFDY